jgi:antitoxin VapB
MGALNIKDADVAAKARKLAKLRGKSITEAVSEALDESLKAANRLSEEDRKLRRRKTEEIVKRFQEIVPPDSPVWDALEDMYDENGLPK